MNDLLKQMMKGVAQDKLNDVAQSMGMSPETANKVLEGAGPLLGQAVGETAQTKDGAGMLQKVLDAGQPDTLADEGVMGTILGHVGGDKLESLAKTAGVDSSQVTGLISKMAPSMLGNIDMGGMDMSKMMGLMDGVSMDEAKDLVMDYIDADNDGQIMDDMPGLFGKMMKWVGKGK